MKNYLLLVSILVGGCQDQPPQLPDWSKVESVEIVYTVKRERRGLGVDPKQVMPLFKVTGTKPRAFAAMGAAAEVHFRIDSETVVVQVASKDVVQLKGYGLVLLDPRFVGKLNEIVSEKEGRPFDLTFRTADGQGGP